MYKAPTILNSLPVKTNHVIFKHQQFDLTNLIDDVFKL